MSGFNVTTTPKAPLQNPEPEYVFSSDKFYQAHKSMIVANFISGKQNSTHAGCNHSLPVRLTSSFLTRFACSM
jgi:hypothetical protein